MSNPYYDPEKFGLQTVGEVDFSTGSYEFDLLVVWQRIGTEELLYGEDSGCSCPLPFEGHSLAPTADDDLKIAAATKHEIAERITEKLSQRESWYVYESTDRAAADLIERLMRSR